MKRRVFIISMVLFILVFIFCEFKFLITGNNKSIEDVDELNKYILSIKNYNAEAIVTVFSNKNSNTYMLNQSCKDGVLVQTIEDSDSSIGVVIESEGNRVTVRNTELSFEMVFDMYEEACNNSLGLDAFLEDYVIDNHKGIDENDTYFIVNVKAKNSQNKYSKSKVLYFNKENNSIEKIVVKDINNNEKIIIEYSMLEIL